MDNIHVLLFSICIPLKDFKCRAKPTRQFSGAMEVAGHSWGRLLCAPLAISASIREPQTREWRCQGLSHYGMSFANNPHHLFTCWLLLWSYNRLFSLCVLNTSAKHNTKPSQIPSQVNRSEMMLTLESRCSGTSDIIGICVVSFSILKDNSAISGKMLMSIGFLSRVYLQ